MAYVDVDKFAEKICDFQAIDEDAANKMIWLLRTFPTADVVPKSEVEEIFVAVDEMMDLVCAMAGCTVITFGKYAELKKKYTEEGEKSQ